MVAMSPSVLSTAPLFQTSLRDWQANWKARQAFAEGRPASRAVSPRFGRLARRPRRPSADAPRV
jgi:hypothetical protein